VLASLQGYPKVTPEKPFTYPPPVEVSTSVTEAGYPKVTPGKPFTYPPPVEVSTLVTERGYPKVTPEKPFTYPPPVEVSTSVNEAGYPKVTTEKPFTYPRPVEVSTSVIETGYPKVTPEKPFTYPPPVEVSTLVTERGYPKVTPEKPFTYRSPAETFTGKNAIQGFPKLHLPNPVVHSSPFERSLKGNTNPQNLGELNPFIYNTYTANLEVVNSAASSVENFIHSAPRVAASEMVASRMGAAEPSNSDGRYRPQDEKVDIRRPVPGEPGIDYPVFNSVPDTSFSCNGRPEGRFLVRLQREAQFTQPFQPVKAIHSTVQSGQ
jgi:hypothetical protein